MDLNNIIIDITIACGTVALRQNLIGRSIAHLVLIEGAVVTVRGLDGKPLLTPVDAPQPGDVA